MAVNNITTKIAHAELNLQRKLEWGSRYDTRIIFVAGTAIAMLGVLANASGLMNCWSTVTYFVFGVSFILQGLSLVFVYLSQSPKILAPNTSLIYFGTISKMTFADFSNKFKTATDEEYLEDLLHQIHVNSSILCSKFANLKYALLCLALSVIPWGISICLSKVYSH